MLARSLVGLLVLTTYASAAALPLLPRKTKSNEDSDDEPAQPTKVSAKWLSNPKVFKDVKQLGFMDLPDLQSLSVYSIAGDTSVWGEWTGKVNGATVTLKQKVKFDDKSLKQTAKVNDSEGKKVQKDVLKCDIDEESGKASCVLKQEIETISDGDKIKYTATDVKLQADDLMATPAPGNGALDVFRGERGDDKKDDEEKSKSRAEMYSSMKDEQSTFFSE